MTLPEGPFGEFTGYYAADARPCPVMQVSAIHHRDDPILLGSPPMKPPRFHFGLPFRAASIWSNLETAGVTDVVGVWQHVAQLMTVVALKQRYAGHAKRAALIAAANSYMGRLVVVVDDDVDPSNLADVMWAITTRCEPAEQIDIVRNAWSSALDPRIPDEAKRAGITSHSKAIIEAVRPFGWKDKYPPTSALTADEAREIENEMGRRDCRAQGAGRKAGPSRTRASGASSSIPAAGFSWPKYTSTFIPVGERAGLRELDHDLHRIDVGAAVRPARAEPGRLDQRRDRSHRAGELLAGKRRGADRGRLPDLDFRDIALIQFGAHVQRRKIGDRQQRLQRRGRGELARIDVDLQHRAVDRRADLQLLQVDAGERQIAARGGRLRLVRGRQRRVDAAKLRLALGQFVLRARQRRARASVSVAAGAPVARHAIAALSTAACASNTAVSASATASSALRRSSALPVTVCSSRSRLRMPACASAAA